MKRPILLLLILSLLLGADDPKDKKKEKPAAKNKPPDAETAKKDVASLQGRWRLDALEKDGKAAARADIKDRALFFGGDKFVVEHGGKMHQAGAFQAQPTKRPKAINFAIAAGERGDTTMLGIYQLDGDTLKLCIDPQGNERPKEFKAAAGSERFVALYRRAKSPAGGEIDVAGRYTSVSEGPNGRKLTVNVEIEKLGDGYMVRWGVGTATAYVGIGIRKADQLSVAWISQGMLGIAAYRIENGPKLVGEWTELGGIGMLKQEVLMRAAEVPELPAGEKERKAGRQNRPGSDATARVPHAKSLRTGSPSASR